MRILSCVCILTSIFSSWHRYLSRMYFLIIKFYYPIDPVLMQCNIPNCITSNCTGDVCENCKDGYYLQTNGFCGHCPISCIKCRSLTNCTECIPERYGSYCYNNCPIGCKNRYFLLRKHAHTIYCNISRL